MYRRRNSAQFVRGWGFNPLWCLSTLKFVLTPKKIVKKSKIHCRPSSGFPTNRVLRRQMRFGTLGEEMHAYIEVKNKIRSVFCYMVVSVADLPGGERLRSASSELSTFHEFEPIMVHRHSPSPALELGMLFLLIFGSGYPHSTRDVFKKNLKTFLFNESYRS